jgi:hypothetical protein
VCESGVTLAFVMSLVRSDTQNVAFVGCPHESVFLVLVAQHCGQVETRDSGLKLGPGIYLSYRKDGDIRRQTADRRQ